VEPIPVGTGVRLGVERGAQVLGLDELLDGGQPGRCQSPSRGQPLDALLVCFGPAAATLSRGDQQLGAVGVERFAEFCDRHLRHADDCMREHVQSAEFDRLLVAAVQRAFPPMSTSSWSPTTTACSAPGPTTSARPQAKRD
jgi:hypothetical protein